MESRFAKPYVARSCALCPSLRNRVPDQGNCKVLEGHIAHVELRPSSLSPSRLTPLPPLLCPFLSAFPRPEPEPRQRIGASSPGALVRSHPPPSYFSEGKLCPDRELLRDPAVEHNTYAPHLQWPRFLQGSEKSTPDPERRPGVGLG